MEERRELERFKLRLPAKIKLVSGKPEVGRDIISIETGNISSGGALFHTPNPLPEGTQVKIDMLLNFHRQKIIEKRRPLIKVKGSVLRSKPTGMAIQFDSGFEITLPPDA